MQEANFRCEDCGDSTTELNIHHSGYLKGVPAWEHPDELLHCLCKPHHKERQSIEESLKLEMMKRLRRVPIARLKSVFWSVMEEAMKEAAA